MLERKGQAEGARDRQADALADRPARPRPSAAMTILSRSYIEAYFAAYRAAHAAHRRVIDRRHAEAAVREAKARDLLEQRRRDQDFARAQGEVDRERG